MVASLQGAGTAMFHLISVIFGSCSFHIPYRLLCGLQGFPFPKDPALEATALCKLRFTPSLSPAEQGVCPFTHSLLHLFSHLFSPSLAA